MIYRLRAYRDGDAPALATLTRAAIERIGPQAYSPDQVSSWSARHPSGERFAQRVANGDWIVLASGNDDRPVAYALLEPGGHVDMLYIHPDHARRGLAARLLIAVDAEAARRGIARLYTEASDLARPAFESAGYALTGRREFKLDGVTIHNWAMERRLT